MYIIINVYDSKKCTTHVRREINDESTFRISKVPLWGAFFDLTACKPFTACLYKERNCWEFMF